MHFSPHNCIGFLGKRYFNLPGNEDNDWLHLFEMISQGVNPIIEHSITVERGMYLKENIIRGDKKWEAFSKAVSPLIHVPTLYAFKQYKEKNNPKLGKWLI